MLAVCQSNYQLNFPSQFIGYWQYRIWCYDYSMDVVQMQTPQLNESLDNLTVAIRNLIVIQKDVLTATQAQAAALGLLGPALGQTLLPVGAAIAQLTTIVTALQPPAPAPPV